MRWLTGRSLRPRGLDDHLDGVPVQRSDADAKGGPDRVAPAAPAPVPAVTRSVGPLGQPVRPTAPAGLRDGAGSPFDDAVRGLPPCPLRVRSAPRCRDLDRVLLHVREIAVWAGTDGRVQDTGCFLLMDGERIWHSVVFGDEQGSELIARMRAIPGFDTNLLLDAVSSRSGQIESLWPPAAVAARC